MNVVFFNSDDEWKFVSATSGKSIDASTYGTARPHNSFNKVIRTLVAQIP